MASQTPSFSFSCVLSGHSNDVRCLTALTPSTNFAGASALVSGSRDLSAKVWRSCPETKDREWKEDRVFAKHDRYISSVATMAPNDKYPEGLIYTGTVSGVIRVFSPASSEPLHELNAHANCVSALFVSPSSGTLLSGSWDCSAKVWVGELKAVMVLTGHENAVWAVGIFPESGIMVTGSADMSIRLWVAGKCKKTLKEAHTQAIRDISVVGKDSFLSAGNDGVIKHWRINLDDTSATVVSSVQAHNHFIYTLAMVEPDVWALGGESSGVKIFRHGQEVQTLPVPAISIWSVVCLPNGDIAAGCSDGKVWVFTSDPRRQASENLNSLYQLELSKFQRPAKTELDGINTDDLPGPNALLAPGRRDGQTKMVKDGDVITVHSWSESEQLWTKIGDVVGQPGEQDASGMAAGGGKVTFEGKEYDYVFNIELDDTGGKLKLPYNRCDDAWHVAQKFIHKHELPQGYLETIATFIVKNSGGQQTISTPYKAVDPFTGAGAYTTNGDGPTSMDVDNIYFPQLEVLSFLQLPKLDAMTNKLKEFNRLVPEDQKLDEEGLVRLPLLCKADFEASVEDVLNLIKVLGWPSAQAFPGLDILRLGILRQQCAKLLLDQPDNLNKVFSLLLANIHPSAPGNCQMLALRSLANLFSNQSGAELLLGQRDVVLNRAVALLPADASGASARHVETALATLALNYAVMLLKSKSETEGVVQLLTALCMVFLSSVKDPEARFRVLVALGTLLTASKENVLMASDLKARDAVSLWGSTAESPEKVKECARFLQALL